MKKKYYRILSEQWIRVYKFLGKVGVIIGIFLLFEIVKSIIQKEAYKVPLLLFFELGPLLLIWGGKTEGINDSYTLEDNAICKVQKVFLTKKANILYEDIKGIYFSDAHDLYERAVFSFAPICDQVIRNGETKLVQSMWVSLYATEEVRFRDLPQKNYHLIGFSVEKALYDFRYNKEVFEELLKNCDAHFYFTGNAAWEFTEEIGKLFKKYEVTKERIHQLSENQVIHCKW